VSKLFMKSTPPPTEYTEEQTQSTSDQGIGNANYRNVGQKLTIANREVTKLAFYLGNGNGNSGAVTFKILNYSTKAVILSKVWGDASGIPTELTWCEVEFDTPTLIDAEVAILVNYSSSPSPIMSRYDNTNPKANELKCRLKDDNSWSEDSDQDFAYRYKYYEV